MNARLKQTTGMSLVEATIILMVLSILTAVIAPSAADYINDARQTKAKEDVEAIGTGVVRLLRDTGVPCLTLTTASLSAACQMANKVELLVSGSTTTTGEANVSATAFDAGVLGGAAGFVASGNDVNWACTNSCSEVAATSRDTVDNQLVTNLLAGAAGNDYATVSFTAGGGPRAGLGWRGGYLSGAVGLDPWGKAYQASTLFVNAASDAAGTGEGNKGWTSDVIVISPGQDGTITTPFGGLGTIALGDDVTFVVRGATR